MARSTRGLAGLVVATASIAGLAGPARGDLLYQTGFEPATFQAGMTVDGQGGFIVSSGDPGAITVSTVDPGSGAQDLQFSGRDLSDLPPPDGPGVFAGTASLVTNYDAVAAGNPLVTLEASVRLDGPSTATGDGHTGDLVSLNLEAVLADGSYFSTYLSSDGNAYGFSTDYDAMTAASLGAYHDLKLVLDFASRTSTYFLDGVAFGTKAFDASVNSTVLAVVQFSMYDIDPPATRSDYLARVDNFSIRAVPEPSSLAMGGLACLVGLGLARARGRRA